MYFSPIPVTVLQNRSLASSNHNKIGFKGGISDYYEYGPGESDFSHALSEKGEKRVRLLASIVDDAINIGGHVRQNTEKFSIQILEEALKSASPEHRKSEAGKLTALALKLLKK